MAIFESKCPTPNDASLVGTISLKLSRIYLRTNCQPLAIKLFGGFLLLHVADTELRQFTAGKALHQYFDYGKSASTSVYLTVDAGLCDL